MNSTLDLFINTSAPARRSLVQSYSVLSTPSTPEFVLRDTVRVRLHFMTVASGARTGTTLDLGVTADVRFGAKLASTYSSSSTFLFYSESFIRDASDANDVVFYADINLNTSEFIAAFTGGATSVGLKIETEVIDGSTIQTVSQSDATGIFDVITGAEGPPTSAIPAYPVAPQADKALVGNPAGTAWTFANIVHHLPNVTTLEGGASALDTVATLTIPVGRIVQVVISGEMQQWQLLAGTQATNTPNGLLRPDDYAASTNEKVWNRIA